MKGFRSTFLAIGILIVLGVIAWWTAGDPAPEDLDVTARQVLSVSEEELQSVVWTRADTEDLLLVREDDAWMLREPMQWLADPAQVQALLDQIADLTAESRYEDVDDPAVYGLDDPVLTVRLETDEEAYTLHLGNGTPVGAGRYTQLEGDPTVYVLPGETVAVIDKLLMDLRDKRVVPVSFAGVTSIELSGSSAWRLERDGTDWVLQAPFADAADYWSVQGILSQLLGLQADDFVDAPASLAEYGLNEPDFSVTLTTGSPPDQRVFRLHFSHADELNTYYVRREDLEQSLFMVPDAGLSFDQQSAGDLVDKAVFSDAWEDQVQSLSVESPSATYRLVKSDDQWSMQGPGGAPTTLEQASVFPLFRAVRDVTLSGVDAVGETQLPDSDWHVRVVLANGETVSLRAADSGEVAWPAVVDGRAHRYRVEAGTLQGLEEALADVAGEGRSTE